jgi:hypothetical protein
MRQFEEDQRPPVQHAFICVWSQGAEVRFGPYPPKQVGAFLECLMREHPGDHRFFVSLQCAPVDDPVPHLLELARIDAALGDQACPKPH